MLLTISNIQEVTLEISAKTEIVIATWAGRTGPCYWGDRDYTGCDNQSSTFKVSLLGVLLGAQIGAITVLCGGRSVMGVSTAISLHPHKLEHSLGVEHHFVHMHVLRRWRWHHRITSRAT